MTENSKDSPNGVSRKLAQREAELALINSVQKGLLAQKEIHEIYELIGNRLKELFDAQVTGIYTFDHEKELEYFQYLFEDGERLYPDARPLNQMRKWIIKHQDILLINESTDEIIEKITGEKLEPVPGTRLPKSLVFVPLIVNDQVKGCLSLQNLDREHAFSDSDVQLLNTLANSISIALENARLFNETTRLLAESEKRATELQTVNRISQALVSQLEFEALIQLIGKLMKETFNADIVYVALYDRETDMIRFPYEYGDKNEPRKFGDGFTERIISNNEPLLINKDIEEIREQLKAKQIGRVTASFLGVPVQIGNKPIGVISVQSTEEENRFNENDLHLLSTIAANVSVAMQNADAYQKLRATLEELKSAQEQLVRQEKLASLGQLTAGIAHEIKNPLNFVNNFSELSIELIEEVREEVKRQKAKVKNTPPSPPGRGAGGEGDRAEKEDQPQNPDSESNMSNPPLNPLPGGEAGSSSNKDIILDILDDIEANLSKIHEHGTRADGIVKSMLLHSRGKSGEHIPTDLNKLLDEYVKLSYHGMRAVNKSFNIDMQFDFDESIGVMDLVAQDLSRAFLNIINNAMYASYDYSKTKDDHKPVIKVSTKHTGDHVEIRIRDNGPGIPDEIHEKIFEPFFTTKPTGEGTGLGLSMTHDIIKLHQGNLDVETEPGAFTEFIITLPITNQS